MGHMSSGGGGRMNKEHPTPVQVATSYSSQDIIGCLLHNQVSQAQAANRQSPHRNEHEGIQ